MCYGDAQKPISTLVECFWKILEFLGESESYRELCCHIVTTFRVCISPDRVQIATWVIFWKVNVAHWPTKWWWKVFISWYREWQKCLHGVLSIFSGDSDLQKAYLPANNGLYGLHSMGRKFFVGYGDAQKPISLLVGWFCKNLVFSCRLCYILHWEPCFFLSKIMFLSAQKPFVKPSSHLKCTFA